MNNGKLKHKLYAGRPKNNTWMQNTKRMLIKGGVNSCWYCNKLLLNNPEDMSKRDHRFTLDHYIPLARGGNHSRDNVVACCVSCNRLKADMMPDKFLKQINTGR